MEKKPNAENKNNCEIKTGPKNGADLYGVNLWNKEGERIYTKEKLIARIQTGERLEYFFFWMPETVNLTLAAYLSQWQPAKFWVNQQEFSCTEQYMMREKARIFGDQEIQEKIMQTQDPQQMQTLGRQVRGFEPVIWDQVKYAVVLNGNYHKFTQNPEMGEALLSTEEQILVEASPIDQIWGIGLGVESALAKQPEFWPGDNGLGFALMEVRDELRRI